MALLKALATCKDDATQRKQQPAIFAEKGKGVAGQYAQPWKQASGINVKGHASCILSWCTEKAVYVRTSAENMQLFVL